LPYYLVVTAARFVSILTILWGGLAQAQTPAPKERPIAVAIVGASASAGFSDQFITATTRADREHNASWKLARALEPLFAADAVEFKDCSDQAMFLHAEQSGERQIERALRAEPDVVVAVDFLFWFGYSVRGGDRARRLALQDAGLAVLARVDRPLLVGDYPEMRDIDPRMLGPHAIPDAETLRLLNERLRAWAKERAQVSVFPLHDLLAKLRDEKCLVDFGERRYELEARALLQTDRLHVTRLGMAVLASHLTEALAAQAPHLPALQAAARTLPEVMRRLDLVDLVERDGRALPPLMPARAEPSERGGREVIRR